MSTRHKTPLDHEIRERIMAVEDERRRLGFMAQYLWLGRVSEVFGKYMPTRDCFRLTEFEGEEAVMFIVRTAKRKGRLRPVALPLKKEYEPWAEPLYQYIANSKQEYPFALHENAETSKKYAMTAARRMFDGLWWPMIDYTRSSSVPYTPEMVLKKDYNKKGQDQYLVEFPDGTRVWTTSRETANINVKVEPRWKPATSHVDRKRRTLTLAMNYLFDGISLSLVGGWTNKSQDENIPQAVKHYLWLDLSEINESVVEQLKNMANRSFKKLLIPYSNLI
jgi:hypothetical protein